MPKEPSSRDERLLKLAHKILDQYQEVLASDTAMEALAASKELRQLHASQLNVVSTIITEVWTV